MDEVFGRFNVVAFWFDPSHAKDDDDGAGYWDTLIDSWHRKYGDRLRVWAQTTGDRRSAVAWDMVMPSHQVDFVAAVERFTDEMESHDIVIDGHPALVRHLTNARRYMTKFGLSLSKQTRNSTKKVDLAVCAVGARMLRRLALNKEVGKEPERSGRVWW